MPRGWGHAGIALAMGMASASAMAAGTDDAPRYGALQSLQFDNGLRVVVQHTPGDPTVAASWRIDAGWQDEPEDLRGAAHLVEHLWYRTPAGTSDRWHDARARGCTDSASTTQDETVFHRRCPSHDVDTVLDAIIDQLDDPLEEVSDAVVAVETAVIAQEARERTEGGRPLVRAVYRRLLPADHPIHDALAEPAPTLSRTDALEAWVAERYAPENVVVAISGGATVEQVRGPLEAAFGPATAATPPKPRPGERYSAPPGPHAPETHQVPLPRATGALVWAWNLPAPVADSSISAFTASHLEDALAEELGEEDGVLGLGCQVSAHPLAGALICAVDITDEAPSDDDLRRWADRGLERAWRRAGRRDVRLSIAQERDEAPQDMLFSHSRASVRARAMLSELGAGQQPRTVEDRIEGVRDWKPERLMSRMADWTAPERAAHLRVVPDPQAVEDLVIAQRVRAVGDRARPDSSRTPIPLPELSVAERRLDSGLVVLGISQPASPYVMVSARVSGGHGIEPAGLAGFAERFSVAPGRRESTGVRTGERMTRDYVEVFGTAPADQLARTSRAVRDQLRVRVAVNGGDEGERRQDRFVRRQRKALEIRQDEPPALASVRLSRALLADHAPSQPIDTGLLDAYEELGATQVLAYLRRTYQPGNTIVLVTGPEPAEVLADTTARIFEAWRPLAGVIPAPYPLAEPAGEPEPTRLTALDPGLQSARLSWRCRLPDDLDQTAGEVLQDVLWDAAWRRLRHRSGLIYTPSVGIDAWPDGTRVLSVDLRVASSRVSDALGQWEATVQALQRAPDDDVQRSLGRVRTRMVRRLTTPEGAEDIAWRWYRTGQDWSALPADLEARLSRAPQEYVQPLQRCLSTRSWLVQGPEAALQVATRLGATRVEPAAEPEGEAE